MNVATRLGVPVVALAAALGLLLALTAPGTASAARRHRCGRVVRGSYTLYRKGSTCRRVRQVLRHFDHQIRTGTRHLVPGGRNMADSQLPFKVYDWRCGGLQGRIFCMQGRWKSPAPPRRGHAWLDAILRY